MAIAAFKYETFLDARALWDFVKTGDVRTVTAIVYDAGSGQFVVFYV